MNLGRAKTIFIFAFLGLNLFLGYHLYRVEAFNLARVAVTVEELKKTEEQLNRQNYYISTAIDRTVRTSAFLTVSPEPDLQADILEQIAGPSAKFTETEQLLFYQGQGVEMIVHPGGLTEVVYEPGAFLAEGCSVMEERKLLLLVEKFLQQRGLKPEHAHFDFVDRGAGSRLTVHYYQSCHGTPLFAGYLKVVLEGDLVIAVELYWLELAVWPLEREMEVIPATDALLRLVEALGPSPLPRHIVKADLGFFSRDYNAEKWEVPPVWRFVTDGGDPYYVNAFTGNLEMDL